MSLAAVVEQVGQVLGRAQALFADPALSGAVHARAAVQELTEGAGAVRTATQTVGATQVGQGPQGYRRFAAQASAALEDLAVTEDRLAGRLGEAAATDRAGHTDSGRVVHTAAAQTAALAPATATPAGQQALLKALQAKVSEQQQVVAAYAARDAKLAALVRSLAYQRAGAMPAGMPLLGAGGGPGLASGPAGGGGGGSLGGAAAPVAALAGSLAAVPQGVPRPPRGSVEVPDTPGRVAAEAALSRRGAPYVWGAKGPNRFDCSGLTQWAWAKAGVPLGPDTYTQIRQGVAVPPDQVRAGDLIFPLDSFGEAGRSGPGHVQLAIGPESVVHAPTSGDVVRIAPMPERFIARRPVPPAVG